MIEHAKENNQQMYLAGFTYVTGGNYFNFILNTGQQTDQKDKDYTYTKMMLPDGAHLKIRKVVVYIYNKVTIAGFKLWTSMVPSYLKQATLKRMSPLQMQQ